MHARKAEGYQKAKGFETIAQFDTAKRSFAATPEVQQCYYVTGEADFILVIVVHAMSDIESRWSQIA